MMGAFVARAKRARAWWLKAGVLGAGSLQSGTGGAGVESSGSILVSGLGDAAADDGSAQLGKAAELRAVVVAQRVLGGAGIEIGSVGTGQRVAGSCSGWVNGRGCGPGGHLGPGRKQDLQAGKGGVQGSQLAGNRTRSGRGWG